MSAALVGLHNPEVAFALLIQRLQVQIPALPKFFLLLSLQTVERLYPLIASARDFANAVNVKGYVLQKSHRPYHVNACFGYRLEHRDRERAL